MTTPRPLRLLTRTAHRLAISLALGLAALAVTADIIEPIEGQELGGRLTLEPDATTATVTDAQGNTQSIPLIDISEVRMGQELAVIGDGNLLLINNDHAETTAQQSGSIQLRAGLHRFVLPYWQGTGPRALSISVSGPGIDGQVELGEDHLRCHRRSDVDIQASEGIDSDGFRMPEIALDEASDRRAFRNRANYKLYIGDTPDQYRSIGAISQMRMDRQGNTTDINASFISNPTTGFAVVFDGFFVAPHDGEYQFTLSSDDGSQLYFGSVDQFISSAIGSVSEGPTPWTAELSNRGTARGELLNIADQQLAMNLPLGDEQSTRAQVGLSHVVAVWHQSDPARGIDRSDEPTNQDTAYIRDRENPAQIRSVSGTVLGLNEQELAFEFRGEARVINRDRVVGLVFADSSRPAAPNPGFHQSVSFSTGQVLPCRLVSMDDRVVFELIGGSQIDAPRQTLAMLRCENGRLMDLTQIQPTAEEAIPYFGLAMPARVGTNFSGQPIRLFDQTRYDRAIAVHSKSRLYYRLDRPCERFRAVFGLMDPGGSLGNVTARVIGDGQVLWEQDNITAETGAIQVDVPLAGVERIILEVDFGEGQNVGDRAAWCNPELIFERQTQ